MLKTYENIHSNQEIAAKRLCFSAAMVTFNPMTVISSMNSPASSPILLSSFSESELVELENYLRTYTEKPYVLEGKGTVYVAIPSMYPTSTSCLLLRMNMKPSVFLRFVKEKEELFVLSSSIGTTSARMSPRLDAEQKIFFELCADIERIFTSLERFNLSFSDDEVIDGYCEQLVALSEFLSVPLEEITVDVSEDGVPIKSNFALFTAFCTTMMMLARNEATDRRLKAKLDFFGGSVVARLSFKTEKNIRVTNETFLWEYLATDKRMLFEAHSEEERFCVTFQPLFRDWSYLGMKQEPNSEIDFEET